MGQRNRWLDGDRCQNIVRNIIYMVLGMDIRHIKLDDVLVEIEAQSEQDDDPD